MNITLYKLQGDFFGYFIVSFVFLIIKMGVTHKLSVASFFRACYYHASGRQKQKKLEQ